LGVVEFHRALTTARDLTDTTRHALRSPKERPMPYRIAGIDVHKKMLAVVVADVEVDGDFHFERQKVGTTLADLRRLADCPRAASRPASGRSLHVRLRRSVLFNRRQPNVTIRRSLTE
jgi:hypothetical protein